jgi:hypothetical protein
VIKKIGGSEDKGGIVSTINAYINSNKGNPSISRFGIRYHLINELDCNNKVEFYCIFIKVKSISLPIKYFNGICEDTKVDISFKSIEKSYVIKFTDIFGEMPKWNYQERGDKWPDYIKEEYNKRKWK